ncbi:unnamed protein product [Lathyrus sativus]|nr:unnamed protein product [Lathyrus sativus]
MIKRLPGSRNQRSKGVKIKHVLQVILLLGVCFWLIYQVKHNHDKKKEFDKNDSTLSSVRTETDTVVKLGRKDLHPVKDEVDQNEKQEEEDEPVVEDAENKREHGEQEKQGNKHETEEREEQDEEENKHGTEEQEEGENKTEEIEDEGDVEIDENDHENEKSDVDNDQDDEDADELKDKVEDSDETENEDKEDEEKGGLDENHEAREEHYKGDDASSAVAHDTHATSTETESINLTQADLSERMNIKQPDNTTSFHSDENNRIQNDSDLSDREHEVADAVTSNVTSGKEIGNDSLSTETAETKTDSHLDVRSNLTAVVIEASNNSTGAGDDTANSSEQIKRVIVSESDNAQNATANTTVAGDIKQTEGLEQSGNKTSEGNLPDNDATVSSKPENHDADATVSIKPENHDADATVSIKPENHDAAPRESPTLGASALEKTIGVVASNETENISGNLDINVTSDTTESDKSKGSTETNEANETQNTDATMDEMFKSNTQTRETDEKPDSSNANEILDSVIHDAIDSSDTQNIHEDMATAQTDLDTLPEIQTEGNDGDENSAE